MKSVTNSQNQNQNQYKVQVSLGRSFQIFFVNYSLEFATDISRQLLWLLEKQNYKSFCINMVSSLFWDIQVICFYNLVKKNIDLTFRHFLWMLCILTSVWVLCTPNAGRNMHFQRFCALKLKQMHKKADAVWYGIWIHLDHITLQENIFYSAAI